MHGLSHVSGGFARGTLAGVPTDHGSRHESGVQQLLASQEQYMALLSPQRRPGKDIREDRTKRSTMEIRGNPLHLFTPSASARRKTPRVVERAS